MYVITHRENDVVLDICKDISYQDNGYPRNTETETSYVVEIVKVHIADYVPEEVEPMKYCYTPEDGFYPNPSYREPNKYGIPDKLVEQIKNDAITEVEEAVTNGTYE